MLVESSRNDCKPRKVTRKQTRSSVHLDDSRFFQHNLLDNGIWHVDCIVGKKSFWLFEFWLIAQK